MAKQSGHHPRTRSMRFLAFASVVAAAACNGAGGPEALPDSGGDVVVVGDVVAAADVPMTADGKSADVRAPDGRTDAPRGCGLAGESCCAVNPCDSGGCCVAGSCVGVGLVCPVIGGICNKGACTICGAPGETCCPADKCDGGGCCVTGRCLANGMTCADAKGKYGLCADGKCDCGTAGKACCPMSTPSAAVCVQPGTACAVQAGDPTCTTCGVPGGPCCPGDKCEGLVLLDVALPDGDGFRVARELTSDRRTARTPILFLSGATDLPSRVRDLHGVEADFLRKPYALDELLARVEHALERGESNRRLNRTARIDELTGLGNLRLFQERMAIEASRIERYGTVLSIVVIDVDALKAINDRHGHSMGSAVLKAIGGALAAQMRDTDMAARYGGDEFVAVLPHTELAEAGAFADRLIGSIRRLRPAGLPVSVSVGVASFDAHADGYVQQVFERADAAAYRAKRLGGDRVCRQPSASDASAA